MRDEGRDLKKKKRGKHEKKEEKASTLLSYPGINQAFRARLDMRNFFTLGVCNQGAQKRRIVSHAEGRRAGRRNGKKRVARGLIAALKRRKRDKAPCPQPKKKGGLSGTDWGETRHDCDRGRKEDQS